MQTTHPLHEKAVALSKHYLATEAELLVVIQAIDRERVFQRLGYSSLHAYVVGALKLSDSTAYNFISVARKSVVVPELKAAVTRGELNVNTARKIVAVLTPENHTEWIDNAKTMKQKDLEKAVAATHPQQAVKERIQPVCANRLEMKCGITPELEAKLKRVQDLESQRTKKTCTLEQALEIMTQLYLEKTDPVKKAERFTARQVAKAQANPKSRKPSAPVRHQVVLRDQGQCTLVEPQGKRCEQRRWTDLHHVTPFSKGGLSTVENLTTLCRSHHAALHALEAGPVKFAQRHTN